MELHADDVVIEGRYNGPPRSGNGGYAAGLVAEAVGPEAEVRLLRPPPLDVPLRRTRAADGTVRLEHGDAVVATGTPRRPEGDVPPAPDLAAATRASAGYAGRDPGRHPWPTCFVCGPSHPDGLRVFPGPVGAGPLLASPWTPSSADAEDGAAPRRFVWAALDCPSGFACMPEGGQSVLASMTAALVAPVLADRPHVVTAWPLGREGRKHRAGSALHDPDGRLVAFATALWITLDRPLEAMS